jgi:hypothetical protein
VTTLTEQPFILLVLLGFSSSFCLSLRVELRPGHPRATIGFGKTLNDRRGSKTSLSLGEALDDVGGSETPSSDLTETCRLLLFRLFA